MAENTKAVKEALEHEIDYLRNRLADRLAEKDHLLFHVCRRLESDYMIQIGCHEIKNFAALGKVLRIKRELAMVQDLLECNEPVFLPAVESQLNKEFEGYDREYQRRVGELNYAIEYDSRPMELSEKGLQELTEIYRQVLLDLHPDLNPGLIGGSAQRDLLISAMEAYSIEALGTLFDISEQSSSLDPACPGFIPREWTVEELQAQRDSLNHCIAATEEQIERIKKAHPYNERELLDDRSAIEKRQRELEDVLEEYKEQYKVYENELWELLGGGD